MTSFGRPHNPVFPRLTCNMCLSDVQTLLCFVSQGTFAWSVSCATVAPSDGKPQKGCKISDMQQPASGAEVAGQRQLLDADTLPE